MLGLTVDCPDEDEIVAYAQGHLGGLARQRLVAHVDGCAVCAALVAEAVRGQATRREDEPALGDDPLRPALTRGRSLGRYLVLAPLGEGGLGRVVAAYDPQLDRRVAIKLLDPRAHRGLTPEQLRGRLLREAQALAKLRHPNVVAVHDVGMTDDEPALVFLAMELVEGATLREWLQQSPRSWPQIREVFVAAARGLAAAHAAGLVHRDVKPGNVLVGDDGRVQVVDFGLARALDRDASSAQGAAGATALDDGLSRASGLVGTPAYMAPEQLQGSRVDARADQFALCVALFEALWGVRPFGGATVDQLRAAVLAGVVAETPPRGVPTWLRRVVLRGLSTDPAQRWPSIEALIDALQQDRRRRRGRAIAATSTLLALGAAGWALVLAPMLAPDADAAAEVDALADQARAAAAKAHFAHPPFDEPDRPTAYTKVLELEALGGEAEALADARAAELRDEFAATLVGLGDHYWDLAQGRPFAAEYYAAALVFDEDHPRALSRIGSSIAAIMALREHAATLSFVPEELIAAAPSQALATTDPQERARRLEAAYAHVPEPPAALTVALEAVLDERERSAVRRGRARQQPGAPAIVAVADDAAVPARALQPSSLEPAAAVPGTTVATAPKPNPRAEPQPAEPQAAEPRTQPDPARARTAVGEGNAALRRGALDEAASAFHRALAADRDDVGALSGLAEVSFQRRAYDTAADYLERAIAAAPKNPRLRLDLGDVYFKVLRYDDARAQYQRAAALGDTHASARIARLDARLGAAP